MRNATEYYCAVCLGMSILQYGFTDWMKHLTRYDMKLCLVFSLGDMLLPLCGTGYCKPMYEFIALMLFLRRK